MTQRSARADRWIAEAARLRRWLDSEVEVGYNQIVGVSDESDTVSDGPGSLLTPEGRGRSRTRGVRP